MRLRYIVGTARKLRFRFNFERRETQWTESKNPIFSNPNRYRVRKKIWVQSIVEKVNLSKTWCQRCDLVYGVNRVLLGTGSVGNGEYYGRIAFAYTAVCIGTLYIASVWCAHCLLFIFFSAFEFCICLVKACVCPPGMCAKWSPHLVRSVSVWGMWWLRVKWYCSKVLQKNLRNYWTVMALVICLMASTVLRSVGRGLYSC